MTKGNPFRDHIIDLITTQISNTVFVNRNPNITFPLDKLGYENIKNIRRNVFIFVKTEMKCIWY